MQPVNLELILDEILSSAYIKSDIQLYFLKKNCLNSITFSPN